MNTLPAWLSLERNLTGLCKNTIRGIKYYRQQIKATPAWADKNIISAIYRECARLCNKGWKMEVDHIVPFNSLYVCGLHCEANLKIIPAIVNLKKSNYYWPGMWNEQMVLNLNEINFYQYELNFK